MIKIENIFEFLIQNYIDSYITYSKTLHCVKINF